MKTIYPLLLVFLFFFCFSTNLYSQVSLEPNFSDELVKGGWNQATGIVNDSTGQSYVWDLKGRIWVIDSNGNKISNQLLDIKDEVGNWRAHGLHSVCLDPNFRTNGYFYCYYAVDRYYLLNSGKLNYNSNSNQYYNASILRVTRFTADINTNFTTLVPNSRLVLIGETKKTGIPLLHVTHDGGTILFGNDGSLLVFTGDEADYGQNDVGFAPGTYWAQALADSIIRPAENVGCFRSQLLNCLNGKVLRVDPTNGNGLSSNPFYDTSNARSAQSRVYALGLRQPYRCSIKPGTGSSDSNDGNPGTLIVSEVGWVTWEGVWFVDKPGQNLGWPIFEGLNRTSAFQSPIYNIDAPNPLFGTDSCNSNPYFSFQNLLVNSTYANPLFPNPCNNAIEIPATINKYKWFPPIINYRHSINSTQVPYNITDSIVPIAISNPLANVIGDEFSGNAGMAGPWYTGQNFPSTYENTYFNFDYGSQWIKNFRLDSNNKVLEVHPFASNLGEIVYLTMNTKDGCLYYLKLEGELRKICYTGSNNTPPTAKISLQNNYSPTQSLTCYFSAENSSDPEGDSLSYSWDFGNGLILNSKNVNITFTTTDLVPERNTIRLTVSDQANLSSTDSVYVYLNNAPPNVNITSIIDSSFYSIGEPLVIDLIADVNDNEADSTLTYEWQSILFHEEHEHPEPIDQDHITYTTLSIDGCGSELFWWEINLTVTDAQGLKNTDQVKLYPDCKLPEAKIISPDTACKSSTVNFIDDSYNTTSVNWIFENGQPATSVDKNPIVAYLTNGVYKVTLIAYNTIGTDTTFKYITIRTNSMKPKVTFTPNDTICRGDSILLEVIESTGASALQWYKGKNLISNAITQSISVKELGSYKVLVSDEYGCTKFSNIQKVIVFDQTASIIANSSTNICTRDSVQLSANQGMNFTYQWTRNNTAISDANSTIYYAKTAGTYKCIVSNYLGCSKVSNSVKVKITCKIGVTNIDKSLISISPNPVINSINISFHLLDQNEVYFVVIDALGREVIRTNQNKYSAGTHTLNIDANKLKDGLYILQTKADNLTESMHFEVNKRK